MVVVKWTIYNRAESSTRSSNCSVSFGHHTPEIGCVALALLHRLRRPASTNGKASTATSQVSTESCVGGLGKLDDAALQRDRHSVSPVVCI
jgi:hypothetical protein